MSGTSVSLYHLQPTSEQPLSSSSSSSSSPIRQRVQRRPINIAVVGCAHGELQSIYDAIAQVSSLHALPVHAVLCCGDFQACRNKADLSTLACPAKYRTLTSFALYHARVLPPPPILTLYIGGNHEASNLHTALPYGGYVCHNVYYLGLAGVVRLGGWRIGGLSGIYKPRDWDTGHWERLPLDDGSMRSVYHVRCFDAWMMMQLVRYKPENTRSQQQQQQQQQQGTGKRKREDQSVAEEQKEEEDRGDAVDRDEDEMAVMMSHDWPRGIARHGDVKALLRRKPFLRDEIDSNTLGSAAAEQLLQNLRPRYFLSAHLHVKFAALYPHSSTDGLCGAAETQFLALDKALPGRDYMQLIPLPPVVASPSDATAAAPAAVADVRLQYDLDWLCVVRKTHHLVNLTRDRRRPPTASYCPTDEDRRWLIARLRDLRRQQHREGEKEQEEEERMWDVPLYDGEWDVAADERVGGGVDFVRSRQTAAFCRLLHIPDLHSDAHEAGATRQRAPAPAARGGSNPDEIDLGSLSDTPH